MTIDVIRETNRVGRLLRRIIVGPKPSLLVVPVHVHMFMSDTNVANRKSWANVFVDTYDDRGSVQSSHNTTTDLTSASLRRVVDPGPATDLNESAFTACDVQLRLASVQFHPRPSSLLISNRVVANCEDCNIASCGDVASDAQTVASGVRFSRIGAELRRFFDNVPDGMPQGIHVLVVDDLQQANGTSAVNTDGGYGCKGITTSRPPFAVITQGFRVGQIHEVAHVLGLLETAVDRGVGGSGFVQGDCDIIRSEAQRIINLPD